MQGSVKRVAPTSRGSAAYTRKRSTIACQVCRARRTKCDQRKPKCSFCESTGAECISDPPALSAFDPASVAILERLDRLEHELYRFAHAATTPSEARVNPSHQRTRVLADLDHVSQQHVEKILQWPIFHESSNVTSSPDSESTQSAWEFHGPVMWPEPPQATGNGTINEQTHIMLLDQFFTHVHTRNPILDESSSRELSRKIFDRGVGWDSESCLTLLIWANGSAGYPLPTLALSRKDFDQSQAVSLFYCAQQRLGRAFAHADVLSAQCFFLAGVFLMSALRPFDAWRMFSQALAICRIAKKTRAYNYDDSTILESVFWSAWKSERELNRELWTPPEDLACDMPETFPTLPKAFKEENLQAWYFYLSEISAWRLETRVKEECTRFGLEVNGDLEDFARTADGLMEQLSNWQNSLASEVSITDDHEKEDMLRLILKSRALYISELVSWPFLYALVHDCIQPKSHPVQRWTIKSLDYHLQKLQNHRIQFYHRHHGTWIMIRSCARSVSVLIAASTLPFSGSAMPENWRVVVDDTLQMLRFWQGHMEELADNVDGIHDFYNKLGVM